MENLFTKMCELGITQAQLAEKLNVSRLVVTNMVNNPGRFYSEEQEKKLAEIFKCNVYDLYSLDELLGRHTPKNKEEANLLINKIRKEYDHI